MSPADQQALMAVSAMLNEQQHIGNLLQAPVVRSNTLHGGAIPGTLTVFALITEDGPEVMSLRTMLGAVLDHYTEMEAKKTESLEASASVAVKDIIAQAQAASTGDDS